MRRYGLTFLLAVAAVAALAWLLDERVLAPPLMRTTTPRWGPLAEGVYATGVVEPIEWAKVRTEAAGHLLSLLRGEGQDVVAGELLAQIDDQKRRARLVEIESRIRYLETERERLRVLVAGGVASRKALQLVDSDLDQARALRTAAADGIREARVTAPIAGRILRREGRVGEVVDAGTVLFWIGDPAQRQIVAEIDEEYFPRIGLHQRAVATADAFPGIAIPGRVTELTPFGDAGQRSYRIKIVLDEPPPGREPLPFGTTVEVNIVVRAADRALLVPRAALAGSGLWVVEGGRAAYRRVTVGLRGRDIVEIVDGVAAGEEVVLDPPASLRSAARVRSLRVSAP